MSFNISSFCQPPITQQVLQALPPATFVWDPYNEAEAIVFGPNTAHMSAPMINPNHTGLTLRSSYFR